MKLLRDMFNDLDSFGRFWFGVGIVALAAAAAMSFDFGWGVSAKHAIFLAVLTVVAAFGPMAAEMLWGKGRKGPAIATAIICIPLLGIEFYSHAGYTAGLRGHNIETAEVQNMRFDGAQKAASDDETNLKFWREQLAALQAQAPWAATVKAEGLRAQVEAAQKAIDLEAARGGCKSRCLERMKEKAGLEERIATIEQANSLSERIEKTQRILDGKRNVAATTAHVSSAVAHQNDSLAKWVALVANGDVKASDLQRAASQESANLAMAIAGTGLPAFALFLAGMFRLSRTKGDEDHMDPPPSAKAPVTPMHTVVGMPSEPIHVHTVERDTRLDRWKASVADDVRAMLGASPKQLQAA